MASVNRVPRNEKPQVARDLSVCLDERKTQGPPEPGLDAFIPLLIAVADRLDVHVDGKTTAEGMRSTLLDRLDEKDDVVDTCMRHMDSFLEVEGLRRRSPFAVSARALRAAAFPDGLAHIDDHIVDQNVRCRTTIGILKLPENAATLAGIKLPAEWIPAFEVAVDESDAAYSDLTSARGDKSVHVGMGRDAETEWVDVVTRLRKYVGSRSSKNDIATQMEGRKLLEPLLDALRRIDIAAAIRAGKSAPKPPGASPSPGASPAPGASPSPGASPAPGASPSPGTPPVTGTLPSPGASPSPGTSPTPGTSPSPGMSTLPGTSPLATEPAAGSQPSSASTPA
jgi:hypothetical protein